MKLYRSILTVCGALVLAGTLVSVSPTAAWSVTSAEKQAEADSVMQEIDLLQTNLNEANNELENSQADLQAALAKQQEAQIAIYDETEHIEELQESLASCATAMYKTGGSSTFLDVILESTTFEEFLVGWDAANAVSGQGARLVQQSKDTRDALEQAKIEYEEQGRKAEQHIQEAEEAKEKIESSKQALENKLKDLTEEIAQLQAQEELEREAARLAAEAAEQQAAALAEAEQAAQNIERQRLYSNGDTGEAATYSGGQLAHPLPGGTYSSGFGWRSFNGGSFHQGLDLAAAEGTPYYAAESGTVIFATNDGGYNGGAGNWVVIAHGNGLVTKYMHSSAVYVTPGQRVERGENIGAVGNTGQSFGAHLHFQVEYNGQAVDPSSLIA